MYFECQHKFEDKERKMFRLCLTKSLTGANSRIVLAVRASSSAPAKVPEKIEVFVDDQSVLVEPGTTVLQVNSQ